MALFFDAAWFDARLRACGLDRAAAAAALGVAPQDLDHVAKDQRELSPREVAVLAALLGVAVEEMARRAGAGTPVPGAQDHARDPALGAALARIAALEARVARLEALVEGPAAAPADASKCMKTLDESSRE